MLIQLKIVSIAMYLETLSDWLIEWVAVGKQIDFFICISSLKIYCQPNFEFKFFQYTKNIQSIYNQ